MFDKIIAILAPHDCMVCGNEGALICVWCLPDSIAPLPDRCYRCNAVSQDSAVCVKCRRESSLRYVWARGQYSGLAKSLVYRLKFGRTRAAAGTVAVFLDEMVPPLPRGTLVTYIPTATSRVRLRGYDQSMLIAQAFARLRGLRMVPLLARHGQSRQVGANRKHRLEQAKNNYRVIDPKQVKSAEILLVDDILTTGATLESAARVLKKSGAKRINAAVFAQKQ